MSLLEIANKNSTPRLKLKKDFPEDEMIELILAYLKNRITLSGVQDALNSIGYKASSSSVLNILGQRIFSLIKRGKLKIVKP